MSNSKAAKDALSILETLVDIFPGLIDDETEVNGSNLVDNLTYQIDMYPTLVKYLKGNSNEDVQED